MYSLFICHCWLNDFYILKLRSYYYCCYLHDQSTLELGDINHSG